MGGGGGSLPLTKPTFIHYYTHFNTVQRSSKITVMVNNASSKNKCGWLLKNKKASEPSNF